MASFWDAARFWLRALGYYLLPWARGCDVLSKCISRVIPRLLDFEWYVAATILIIILFGHLVILSACVSHVLNDLGSFESPCVCQASKQTPGLGEQHLCLSIRSGHPFMNLMTCIKSASFLLLACLSVTRDLAILAWSFPKSCLSLGLAFVTTVKLLQ